MDCCVVWSLVNCHDGVFWLRAFMLRVGCTAKNNDVGHSDHALVVQVYKSALRMYRPYVHIMIRIPPSPPCNDSNSAVSALLSDDSECCDRTDSESDSVSTALMS